MVKRTKLKRKSKSESAKLRNEADSLWGLIIQKRDEVCRRPDCPYCQNLNLTGKIYQAHHIFNKKHYHSLRYDLNNGLWLCSGSHFQWAHSDDLKVIDDYLGFLYSLGCWNDLLLASRSTRKIYYKDEIERLKLLLNERV